MPPQVLAVARKDSASSDRLAGGLVTNSLAWLTTTASASVPTRNSIGSRPIARHDSHFPVLDAAAGVGNVGLALHAEPLKPGPAADAVDGDAPRVSLILEPLAIASDNG